ncbi:MAG: thioredoxin domain-containing protein [Patescibacteria group bacterium]
MKNNKYTLIAVAVVLIVLLGGFVSYQSYKSAGPAVSGALDPFATCLKDSGAIFYGAFWCPHCQATKKMFGASAKLLPYVECSMPDGSNQTQVCIDKGIKSYPTWKFSDGSELTGERTLAELAEKTSCELPVQ